MLLQENARITVAVRPQLAGNTRVYSRTAACALLPSASLLSYRRNAEIELMREYCTYVYSSPHGRRAVLKKKRLRVMKLT